MIIGGTNGTTDVTADTGCTTDGAGNQTCLSYSTNSTTPGETQLVAGIGSIPPLTSNSAGFAAPASGGTSYLFKLPATITAGVLHAAAPGTGDGVNESALTSSLVNLAADITGQLPIGNVGSAGLSGTSPINVASTGVVTCSTCVVASSPGAGIAHFAGSTQTVTSSAVVLTDLATQAADTVLMNASGSTAGPTAYAMPTCTSGADLYNTSTHAWTCVAIGSGTVTVVGAGSLTSTALVTGGGSQALQTPSATTTLDASGNLNLAGKLNKVTVTAPATSATLTVADGKTLTATNTMDVAKTAGVAGAIPYYDTTTSQSASALLTQYAVIVGGGASGPPATISVPSADALLYGTTASNPIFKALPTTGTNGCSGATDILQWNNSTHAFACGTAPTYPGAGIPISTGSAWGTSLSETDGDIIYGASSAWTKGTALPNGITATTQSAADNSTKVATTAYADAVLKSQYKIWSCETGVGDGLNAVPAGTYLQSFCYNTTGVTVTLTGLKCYIDGGSSSTMNASGNTLGALLTGAVTCSTAFAAGTQSANVALTSGDYIKFTFVADGTAKQTTWVVTGTY